MKNKNNLPGYILLALSSVALVWLLAGHLFNWLATCFLTKKLGNSIGIIGGADGPTSIYITSGKTDFLLEVILWVVASAVFIVSLVWILKKKK